MGVEFVIPCSLEIPHRRDQLVQLLVPDEGQEGGVDASRVLAVRGIVVVLRTP